MEKENIITVDIEDFKDSQHVLDYIDDDFAIVNSLEGTPYSNDTIKLNCFLIASNHAIGFEKQPKTILWVKNCQASSI